MRPLKSCSAILLCVFLCSALTGCWDKPQTSSVPEAPSSVSAPASSQEKIFVDLFQDERYSALSWLMMEETDTYRLAIPQVDGDSSEASEINLRIKTMFYDEAKTLVDGELSPPTDEPYEVIPYVIQNGDVLNLMILQTPTQEVLSDGEMFCVAYDRVNQNYLTVENALEQDGQTEPEIQAATIKAYRTAFPEVLPEDIASISVEGVLNIEGKNEYICYLSEFPQGGIEYRYVIGYSPASDEVYTLSRYTE